MSTPKPISSESEPKRTNAELKRYTYRELNVKAKQTFRRIQRTAPDGGTRQDYCYKGWEILVNRGSVAQLLNYDVRTLDATLKRSHVIAL